MNNMQQLLRLGWRWVIITVLAHMAVVGHAAKAPVKVLDTVLATDLRSLDPATAENNAACHALAQVYEGLLAYHYVERSYKLVSNLASEMPHVSPDKLVYTFKIQPGIRFQDDLCFPGKKGRELVAADIAYTLKRIAHIQTNSPGFAHIKNKIKGLDQWRETYQKGLPWEYAQDVDGLKIIDKYTIQIELNNPCPLFLSYWAMPCFYIVAKEAVAYYGHNFAQHPVGTGPFILKHWSAGRTLTFTKNPTFRTKYFPKEGAENYKEFILSCNVQLPLVDKVVMHLLPKAQLAWDGFKKRGVDLLPITAMPSVRKEVLNAGQLKSSVERMGIGLCSMPNVAGSYYIFNCEAFPFKDNLKLRQAMSIAFDRAEFNKVFYHNLADLPESIIPVGMVGHRSGYTNPYGKYDLKKAKAYLEEAGYPKGVGLPTITLDIPLEDSGEMKQQAEFFVRCMKKLGIHVQIVSQSKCILRRKINAKATMIHAVEGEPVVHPDASSFLSLLAAPESADFLISDPVYPILYTHMARMENESAKVALYERLNEMAAELVPAIWLPRPPHLVLYHSWVKNATAHFGFGMEQYLSLDMVQKLKNKRKVPIQIKEDTLTQKAVQKLEAGKETVEEGISQSTKKAKEAVQHTKQSIKKDTKQAAEEVEKTAKQVKKKKEVDKK